MSMLAPRVFGLPLCLIFLAGGAMGSDEPLSSELRVAGRDGWVTWWQSSRAPSVWSAPDPVVRAAVEWRPAAAGMEWGELHVAGTGEAWRLLVILVRLDPSRLRLELVRSSREAGTLPAWSLDDLPASAVLGFNAGQFTGGIPWGWLVHRGEVEQTAGVGPLSMVVAVGPHGGVRFLPVAEIPPSGSGGYREAFQSYPVLLAGDGELPVPLRRDGLGVDVEHRDARLAIGELRDGSVLVALTRFAAAGDALGSLPFGPTVPEMAALMGALGCRQAVALDGGVSAQLAVRDAAGVLHSWRGWRRVPLALLAYRREVNPRR
jgi:hypothetical protein